MSDSYRPETIVAEISANYHHDAGPANGPIGKQFELVIEANRQRGYELASWQMTRVRTITILLPGNRRVPSINETIIAVFTKRPM